MTKVVFVTAEGVRLGVDVLPGLTLMEAAVQDNVPGIDGDCGGSCNCGTCHVWVDEPWSAKLPAIEVLEAGMLEALPDARANSRLCCQIRVEPEMEGMLLYIPPHA